jgi:hypothetical protein
LNWSGPHTIYRVLCRTGTINVTELTFCNEHVADVKHG